MSGKRTVLLSNEARREIAKQARALKEERRATLDARHKYLISRLVDAGTLGEPEVEDALISDDKVTGQCGPLFSLSRCADNSCLIPAVQSDWWVLCCKWIQEADFLLSESEAGNFSHLTDIFQLIWLLAPVWPFFSLDICPFLSFSNHHLLTSPPCLSLSVFHPSFSLSYLSFSPESVLQSFLLCGRSDLSCGSEETLPHYRELWGRPELLQFITLSLSFSKTHRRVSLRGDAAFTTSRYVSGRN